MAIIPGGGSFFFGLKVDDPFIVIVDCDNDAVVDDDGVDDNNAVVDVVSVVVAGEIMIDGAVVVIVGCSWMVDVIDAVESAVVVNCGS